MAGKSRRRRRTSRCSEDPRENELTQLSDEKLGEILSLLPNWEKTFDRQQVGLEIERARRRYFRLRKLAPELWNGALERRRTEKQLKGVAEAGKQLLSAIDRLGPLAKVLLEGEPGKFGVDRAAALSEWVKPADQQDPGFIDRAAGSAAFLMHFAGQEADRLAVKESRGRGAPAKLADQQLVAELWSLWAHTHRPIMPDGRALGGRSWPFLDFARSVGRSVDPKFSGEAAARRILQIISRLKDS